MQEGKRRQSIMQNKETEALEIGGVINGEDFNK